MIILLFLLSLEINLTNGAEVCYPPYGCFSDDAPFDEALVQLPWSPKDLDTKFLFFNRTSHLNVAGYLNPEDPHSPSKVRFNSKKKTVVLTHGYVENFNRWWVKPFIEELLKNEDMNVIFVEWRNGANFPYHQAAGNSRLVGAQVSQMIEVILNDTGLDLSLLHLIGFSLGSHVMGYAGRNLRRKGFVVPRISALDPASPYFENKHVDRRIDPTDADFVDVIHSDSKTLVVNGFGTVQLMGHVDFYPNKGHNQPGCWKFDKSVVQYLACSHYRAVRYYIESINGQCPYYAYPCNDTYEHFEETMICSQCPKEGCPRMGYHATKTKPSSIDGYKYFLKTHGEESFCAYQYQIILHTGTGFLKDLDGEVTITLQGANGTEKVNVNGKYYSSGSVEKTMVILKKNIGRLQKVKVEHDRFIDIWYLHAVVVRSMWDGQMYTACFKRWLNTEKNNIHVQEGGNVDVLCIKPKTVVY